MRVRIWLTTLTALPLLAAGAGAQSDTLKLRTHPEPGKTITVTETSDMKVAVSIAVGGKVVKDDKKDGKEIKQYTEKVLEADATGLKKFTRNYAKAAKGEGEEPKSLSYAGKTVVFERRGDKIVAEGEGVDAKDLADLTKSANNDVDESKLVPAKAVKVGDSWTIPKDLLGGLLGEMKEGADIDKLKVTGKLAKAYQKAGQQWGTVEISFEVPINKFGPVAISKPIAFKAQLTLDIPIDGSATTTQAKGRITVKGVSDFEQNGQTITLDITIEGSYREERSAEK
jgi:hypothetical protein